MKPIASYQVSGIEGSLFDVNQALDKAYWSTPADHRLAFRSSIRYLKGHGYEWFWFID